MWIFIRGFNGFWFAVLFERHPPQQRRPSGSSAVFSTFPKHQRLTSAGAGLSWTIWPALTMETFFGVPFNAVLPAQPKHEA